MTEPVIFDPPQPNAALVVGPSDYLVLSYQSLDLKQLDHIKSTLEERFPAIHERILIVSGAEEMAVVSTPVGAS